MPQGHEIEEHLQSKNTKLTVTRVFLVLTMISSIACVLLVFLFNNVTPNASYITAATACGVVDVILAIVLFGVGWNAVHKCELLYNMIDEEMLPQMVVGHE